MRNKYAASVLGAAMLLGASVASAQNTCGFTGPTTTCTVNTTVSAEIKTVATVSLNVTSTSFNPIALADFEAGYKFAAGPTVIVKANDSWDLSVSSLGTEFDVAEWSKPSTDLLWATTGNTPATGMNTTPATLISGTATDATNGGIDYRWKLDFSDDAPGLYSMTVVFTLTAP